MGDHKLKNALFEKSAIFQVKGDVLITLLAVLEIYCD